MMKGTTDNKPAEAENDAYDMPTMRLGTPRARGGNMSMGYFYSGGDSCKDVACFVKEALGNHSKNPVKKKVANELGLYDMSGNVCEWCLDWYDSDYGCSNSDVIDPQGPSEGTEHVCRGGSWSSLARDCRAASRSYGWPTCRSNNLGFRLALVPVQ